MITSRRLFLKVQNMKKNASSLKVFINVNNHQDVFEKYYNFVFIKTLQRKMCHSYKSVCIFSSGEVSLASEISRGGFMMVQALLIY